MQPATDQFQVSRRTLDFEDYVDVIRRHKSWIVGPTFAGLVLAVVFAFSKADQYVSEATIRVVPSTISEKFVPNTVNTQMTERINILGQKAVSRTNLRNLIQTQKLYPKELARESMEDVIETMRRNVRIGQVMNINPQQGGQMSGAFKLTFQYENPLKAQQVVEELVKSFIDENLNRRTLESDTQNKFLSDEAIKAKEELDGIEKKLTTFRVANAGRLPDQMSFNVNQLNGLQTFMGSLQAQVSRSNQEKMVMESSLRTLNSHRSALAPPVEAQALAARNERLNQIEREIQGVELALGGLRERYTPTHPDVVRAESALKLLRTRRDVVAKEEEGRKPEAVAVSPGAKQAYEREARNLDGEISRYQTMIKAKDVEIAEARQKMAEVDRAIAVAQSRMQGMPVGEQQFSELLTEKNLAKQRYEDAVRKHDLSNAGNRVERAQLSETLETLDRASPPQTPSEPKRPTIVGAGAMAGLILGLLVAGVREMKDTSLKNLKDVRAYTQINVLGSIPLLENDVIVRRRKRLGWLAWTTASLAGCLIMTGSVWHYYASRL